MRGQVAQLKYEIDDLDEVARNGDRVFISGAIYGNAPEGIFAGKMFLVDSGEPTGWTVRAGLQEIAGAAEVGGEVEGPGYEEGGDFVLDGDGGDGELVLEGNGL